VKIHFGFGGKKLPGWRNWDKDCNLKNPLPYSNDIVTHVFVENGIEYLTHQEAWKFLEECFRIIKPEGMIRIAFPDISELRKTITPTYRKMVQAKGDSDGTRKTTIQAFAFKYNRRGIWTSDLLETFLNAVGFKTNLAYVGHSFLPEFLGVEQYGTTAEEKLKSIGISVIEGVKL
jgi:predicted SAM-dependent methyltransferase